MLIINMPKKVPLTKNKAKGFLAATGIANRKRTFEKPPYPKILTYSRKLIHSSRKNLRQAVAMVDEKGSHLRGNLKIFSASGKKVGKGAFVHVVGYKTNYLNIQDVWVERAYRKEGLQRQIFSEIIAIAKRKGIPQVRLNVKIGNKVAIKAYENYGFMLNIRKEDEIIREVSGEYEMIFDLTKQKRN
jgi:ribosomal protein S18 acetylase RimI-like enzyme